MFQLYDILKNRTSLNPDDKRRILIGAKLKLQIKGFRHGCGDEIQSWSSELVILRATYVIHSGKDKQFFTCKITYFDPLLVIFLPL